MIKCSMIIGDNIEEVIIDSRLIMVLQKGIEIKCIKCYNARSKQKNVSCNV